MDIVSYAMCHMCVCSPFQVKKNAFQVSQLALHLSTQKYLTGKNLILLKALMMWT